jgi:DNA-binding IclR family transcriptional regulator
MSDDPIPADVREFLLAHIDSIAQLEALLLLHGQTPSEWTLAEIAGRLYITEEQTAGLLARLTSDGLVVSAGGSGRFAYRPASADLARAVDRVAAAYRAHLVPVTNLVHSKPRTRIREFADAFRFRRDQ